MLARHKVSTECAIFLCGKILSAERFRVAPGIAAHWCTTPDELLIEAARRDPRCAVVDATALTARGRSELLTGLTSRDRCLACVAAGVIPIEGAAQLFINGAQLPSQLAEWLRLSVGQPRRRNPRVKFSGTVWLVDGHGGTSQARASNLSESGIRVANLLDYDTGVSVGVRLADPRSHLMSLRARLVWKSELGGTGFAFFDLDDGARASLRSLLIQLARESRIRDQADPWATDEAAELRLFHRLQLGWAAV